MRQGEDAKCSAVANVGFYASKLLIGTIHREDLARYLEAFGCRSKRVHGDGRFEIAGVLPKAIDAFSTRRAAIRAAMNKRGLRDPEQNTRLAERAALMTGRGTRLSASPLMVSASVPPARTAGWRAGTPDLDIWATGYERASHWRMNHDSPHDKAPN